jgi:hypothetical protein
MKFSLHVQAEPERPLRSAETLGEKGKRAIQTADPGIAGVLIHAALSRGEIRAPRS